MSSGSTSAAVAVAAPLVVSVPSQAAAPAPPPDAAAGGVTSLLSPSLWWSLAASIFDCSASPLPSAPEEVSASGEAAFAPLQAPTPLRASALWKLQRAWYEERGLRAWSEATVPHFVTSNSFAARATVRGVACGRIAC